MVAAGAGRASRQWRARGRHPRRQGPDREYLPGDAPEGCTYSADLPLSGELKGELGRDGLPTYFRGKIMAGAGHIIDSDTPDYPMAIDSAEMSVEWDSGRRVLVAPFKIISGANRITLLGHL